MRNVHPLPACETGAEDSWKPAATRGEVSAANPEGIPGRKSEHEMSRSAVLHSANGGEGERQRAGAPVPSLRVAQKTVPSAFGSRISDFRRPVLRGVKTGLHVPSASDTGEENNARRDFSLEKLKSRTILKAARSLLRRFFGRQMGRPRIRPKTLPCLRS